MDTAQLAFDQIQTFLDAEDTHYHILHEGKVIRVNYRVTSGDFEFLIIVRDVPALVGVCALIPLAVPDERRVDVSETVVRANNALSLGRFDYDMINGRLSLHMAMPLAETGVTARQFDSLIAAAGFALDQYHRAFCRLLYGDDLSPVEVIAEAEMDEHD